MNSPQYKDGLLSQIAIRNFRSIREAEIPLGSRLVVLVGENAAGKTAVLEAIAAALGPVIHALSSNSRKLPLLDFQDFHRVSRAYNGIAEIEREVTFHASLVDGPSWETVFFVEDAPEPKVRAFRDPEGVQSVADFLIRNDEFPIIAYYGVERGARAGERGVGSLRRYSPHQSYDPSDRRAGYLDSLSARAVFDDVERWFEAYESLELRRQREDGPDAVDVRLATIRRAVASVVPEAEKLRVIGLPPRLNADFTHQSDVQTLPIASLSAGYLSLITIVMDMARRMAELNPHLDNPLAAAGIVLIDEIDLHLHPRWQQTVITALEETFPKVQFILTTHSPQIITTVDAENIRILTSRKGKMEVHPSTSMEGARAGRALSEVFGVTERPPAEVSPFVAALHRYRREVDQDRWDGPVAEAALTELQEISPDDPELHAINVERRRLAVLRGAAKP